MIHWVFISTGVFLGWSLGANHAVNVFGTAVVSRMVRFTTAAITAGVFVVIGATLSGAGTTRTLTTLGSVNALAGCFTVALAVGLTVTWMTKLKLPISTSQAVVGGIIGWNLFTGSPTDVASLSKIVSSWMIGPLLAAGCGYLLFKAFTVTLRHAGLHILHIDAYTRTGLLCIGALAAYLLGANNIANVMGMFVPASPFNDVTLWKGVTVSGDEQLFLIGGIAIAVGIYTYGERVMTTVGKDLYKITPVAGLVVVLAETVVLFLFTSESLQTILAGLSLPTVPLVPLSSTQVVIGAVIGVGVAKGGRSFNYHILLKIALGWVSAPIAAGLLCFVLLFFVQNVFEQKVVRLTSYSISEDVLGEIGHQGLDRAALTVLSGHQIAGAASFRKVLEGTKSWTEEELLTIFALAELDSMRIDSVIASQKLDTSMISTGQRAALNALHGRLYIHRWQLDRDLADLSSEWSVRIGDSDEGVARRLTSLRSLLYSTFRIRR